MFTERSLALVQIHNKNNTINNKITKLQVAYEIRIGLNATYAKLSGTGKWNKVPKWSGVTVSQLIYPLLSETKESIYPKFSVLFHLFHS